MSIISALQERDSSLEQTALLNNDSTSLPDDVSDVARGSGLLTADELRLTERYDATNLLEFLREQKVSAQTLLVAFRKRATIAQQCVNCLTALLPEALEEAKACDRYLKDTGNTRGPLHGLPISIKEQISLKGHRVNAGFVAWVDNITTEDAHIVKILRGLGAVIFARTSEPQSFMHLETSNNIYGTTIHFRDRKLTAGGSSGGEAALMAMHGSPLGIGGDIGGSIRVRPLSTVIGNKGVVIPSPGNDAVCGTLAPMTKSLRDLETFCKAYSSAKPWTDAISLIPTDILSPHMGRQIATDRPLRVGFLAADGVVSPLPPIRRILDLARNRLSSSPKIECKPFSPYNHARGWTIISGNYFEDQGEDIRDICAAGDEALLPLTKWILEECATNSGKLGSSPQERRVARDTYRQEYAKHWEESDVDVIVAPVTPSIAPPHGTSIYWGYTAIFNLLGYPAIAIPAAKLLGSVASCTGQEKYVPKNDIETHYCKHWKVSDAPRDMPVGIQIVAKRFHESLLMQAAYLIEEALKAG